jgi:preprotein translocase subunit SecD
MSQLKQTLKDIFTNTRVIILIVALLVALLVISPQFNDDGVAIRAVAKDSPAALATPLPMQSPDVGAKPTQREILLSLDGQPINSVADYYAFEDGLEINQTVLAKTNERVYRLTTQALTRQIVTNQTEIIVVEEFYNETTNETTQVTQEVPVIEEEILGVASLGLTVYERPTNNIRKGLDLEGGTRVLLALENQVSPEDLESMLDTIRQRLNVFGVSDVIVQSVSDFTGETYVLVEIAGVSEGEIQEILSQQGKFEAKVGDSTVFTGGDDVRYVCRSADCSGLDPNFGCQQSGANSWTCGFFFNIALSQEAAQRQADATRPLDVVAGPGGQQYLSENLSLFLDNELVDELAIGSTLQGNALTDITISGSGSGPTRNAAEENTYEQMKQLQTVLITGSLPVKLEIIQTDTISPALGQDFLENAMLIGVLSILAVVVIISARYRKFKVAIPTIIAMVSEVILILGFAALIGWRLDLAAIAGIIIAVGSGVDDQIVIVDETLSRQRKNKDMTFATKLKAAFFIIFTAYFTTMVAMLPLWGSGAGLLKGFALTTMVGVSMGVLITRPAFARIVEILYGKKED